MKNLMTRAITGAVLAATALTAGAANAAPVTASATARATILQQITVTNTSDLDFGTVVSGASASTVAISTAGARTCGAGLTCTGPTTSANFDITGTANAVVTITGDNSVTLTSGSNSMTASLTRSAATATLTGGTSSVQVGGTLNVAANQADGAYSGTFNITVDYQ